MYKKHLHSVSVFILLLSIFTLTGCEEKGSINSLEQTLQLEKVGSVQLSFNKSAVTNAQVDNVNTVTALLTRSGFLSIQKDLAISNGTANGTIFNVTEGKWLLTVKAKDSTSTTIYSGKADVEIINSQTTYVTIELAPASTTGNLAIHVIWNAGDGINWTKSSVNPVLNLGASGAWDDYVVASPSVIHNGTIYQMWYSASDGTTYRIGYATSPDGINWTKYSGNPVLNVGSAGTWDDVNIYDQTVLYNGTNYEMWYGAYDGTSQRIGYATSPDGINWTKYSGNPVISTSLPWESSSVGHPTVIFNGTNYELWYSASDGTNHRIGYATSTDGKNWTKYSGNPVLNIGTNGLWDDTHLVAPYVVFDGKTYKMWYSGHDGTNYRLGYATSTDGKNWTKYSGNPVLNLGTAGSWDAQGVYSPTILFTGVSYKLWFTGFSGTSERIGYATSP
ncbi:MAG: hypothetical protein AB1298_00345 [Bacteroidota bacterium]